MFQKNYDLLNSYATICITWLFFYYCHCSSVTQNTQTFILSLLTHFPWGKIKVSLPWQCIFPLYLKCSAKEELFYYHHLFTFQLAFSLTSPLPIYTSTLNLQSHVAWPRKATQKRHMQGFFLYLFQFHYIISCHDPFIIIGWLIPSISSVPISPEDPNKYCLQNLRSSLSPYNSQIL